MQRRISVLFLMVALVAMLLTGCSTITESVGQAVSDQVAAVLPTCLLYTSYRVLFDRDDVIRIIDVVNVLPRGRAYRRK